VVEYAVPFRNDLDAIMARNDALEAENSRLRSELEAEKARPTPGEDGRGGAEGEATDPRRDRAARRQARREARRIGGALRRRALRRPGWITALASIVTAVYAIALPAHLAGLALGGAPLRVSAMVWYFGAFVSFLVAAPAMPSRAARNSHVDLAPRWLKALALGHALYLGGVLVAAVAGAALPEMFAVEVFALFMLSASVLMTWYGAWDD
jgi:hypothetical protein